MHYLASFKVSEINTISNAGIFKKVKTQNL